MSGRHPDSPAGSGRPRTAAARLHVAAAACTARARGRARARDVPVRVDHGWALPGDQYLLKRLDDRLLVGGREGDKGDPRQPQHKPLHLRAGPAAAAAAVAAQVGRANTSRPTAGSCTALLLLQQGSREWPAGPRAPRPARCASAAAGRLTPGTLARQCACTVCAHGWQPGAGQQHGRAPAPALTWWSWSLAAGVAAQPTLSRSPAASSAGGVAGAAGVGRGSRCATPLPASRASCPGARPC